MNKVMLIGRFTRDPESRMSQSNLEVSRFSLAAQGDYTNRNGEREVEFVNCVSFGRIATTINKYCKKGSLISAQGRIRNSSYTAQDGTKRYTTDVVVDQIELLGSRTGGNSSYNENSETDSNPYSTPDNNVANIETTDISEDPYKDFGEEITLSSDDLPF